MPLARYMRWLHTRWPAGLVEKLPEVREDGTTAVTGLRVVGDLRGTPLLKFAADSGARAVRAILAEPGFRPGEGEAEGRLDLAIVGAGVSGMAAALEARKVGLRFTLFESSEPYATIVNFPKRKPIYAYPRGMRPAGDLQVSAGVKEELLDELEGYRRRVDIEPVSSRITRVERRSGELLLHHAEGGAPTRAARVIVAIGRSGDFRRLGVSGEERDKVFNRLHDPADFAGQEVLVVGGGDSALETAVALTEAGARVTLSYRGRELSRPKPENLERLQTLAGRSGGSGSLRLLLGSRLEEIGGREVRLLGAGGEEILLPNEAVFSMIGREAPLGFFRRSGVPVRGEWRARTWMGLALVLLAALFVYHWKTDAGLPVYRWFREAGLFPFSLSAPANPSTLLGTIRLSMTGPGFYYSLAYCLAVVVFGLRRIRRRRTPYVTRQTLTLTAIQVLPLFLLPYVLLPWAGHNGWFDAGLGQGVADALFPLSEWDPQGREYWRAVGLVLAWPLMFWNVFTHEPIAAWLVISLVQTLLVIPLMVRRWGKGAYCGWICSCGALAETVGDTLRQKMPHGPGWNRLNMVGQAILGVAFLLLLLRVASWLAPEGGALDRVLSAAYMGLFLGKDASWGELPFPLGFLNYNWIVDLSLAGILGVGLYFHFSGRVWCRFACPLAALMHVYARFSRFRIFAEKEKCISCNLCTSVCHQGIDVMGFASRGLPLEDPQCVRCSACVQGCPTGVLSFGRYDRVGGIVLDRLPASPMRRDEAGAAGPGGKPASG
jgi:thioredoxin reductase/ferredoxin